MEFKHLAVEESGQTMAVAVPIDRRLGDNRPVDLPISTGPAGEICTKVVERTWLPGQRDQTPSASMVINQPSRSLLPTRARPSAAGGLVKLKSTVTKAVFGSSAPAAPWASPPTPA